MHRVAAWLSAPAVRHTAHLRTHRTAARAANDQKEVISVSGDPWGPLLLQLLLILVNGWFAATEVAVLSLNEAKLRHDAEEGDKAATKLLKLNESPNQFLSTIQVCITLAGFLGAAFAAESFSDPLAKVILDAGIQIDPKILDALCVVGVTLALSYFTLVLGELVPKRLGMHAPEKTARMGLTVLTVCSVLFRPIVWLLSVSTNLLLRLLGIDPHATEEEVTEDDIRMMVDMGEEAGAIEETEKEMIENIFEFNNLTAENVMTHRTDVTSIWVDEEWDTIISTIRETGLSRFPVYNEDMDDIIGTLNTRVFLLNLQAEKPRTVREMLREAYFVPETVQADQLFRDMQTKKVHMAIVVDEYGGMSGIVTMEDLLEEIVGNIYDEFDPQAEVEIVAVDENTWRVSGQAMLSDVAEALGVELPLEEDYDTFGGLIYSQFTTIPEDGSTPELECCGLHIQVEKIEEHRVDTALVTKLATEVKEETD
ncbi:MAG: HlyC/CorC family transporter [Clostridiales bacterium]|nr:HlyC/CorC family transporter [Clostridiales bacterium]